MRKILFSLAACSLLTLSLANAKEYVVDIAHTDVGFKIKHMQISNTKGNFADFKGVVDFDEKTMKLNKLEATIQIASIDTGNEGRDEHLRDTDFFDTKKFPEMKFVMTEFKFDDDEKDEGIVKGDLTIKGVTKPIELEYEFGGISKGDVEKIGFNLSGKIDRTEFGVGEKSLAIGSEVKLDIEIEADAK